MDDIVLYLSSSYFEGATCPLARLGYSRDGKKGKSQVNLSRKYALWHGRETGGSGNYGVKKIVL